jgi:hypothetical protein
MKRTARQPTIQAADTRDRGSRAISIMALVVSIGALGLSATSTYYQFFRETRNFTASIMNFDPLKLNSTLVTDIVLSNDGNREEVLLEVSYLLCPKYPLPSPVGRPDPVQETDLSLSCVSLVAISEPLVLKRGEIVPRQVLGHISPERWFRTDLFRSGDELRVSLLFKAMDVKGHISETGAFLGAFTMRNGTISGGYQVGRPVVDLHRHIGGGRPRPSPPRRKQTD